MDFGLIGYLRHGGPDQKWYNCSAKTDEGWYATGDLIMISMSSTISGYFFWHGAVYCNYPRFIYLTGAAGLAVWTSSCLYCMTLATSRLAEIAGAVRVSRLLCRRNCFWICLFALTVGIIFGVFTPAPLFNSPMGAWFFSPFNESGRLLYIQAFIICTTHVGAAWGYLLMNYIPGFPPSLVLCGHIAWQWSHGVPGLVYFFLNRTIRRSVCEIFGINPKIGVYSITESHRRRASHLDSHTHSTEKPNKL
ncbi:unnamed protein product, partial [Mesorhabditis spiculigera]